MLLVNSGLFDEILKTVMTLIMLYTKSEDCSTFVLSLGIYVQCIRESNRQDRTVLLIE